ncbi:hypothetical protein HKD37_01G001798 [Glycine soja]
MYITNRGRSGGHRTFNRGTRRVVSLGAPISTNPFTSSIHISTSESMIRVIAPAPHTSIPITPVEEASPSASYDSLTPEYPPNPNCEHIVDQRGLSFVHIKESKFQPTYGCSSIISNIIRAKFDEPTASWLKVSIDLRDKWFREFKFLFPILCKKSIGGTQAPLPRRIDLLIEEPQHTVVPYLLQLTSKSNQRNFKDHQLLSEVMEKTKKLKSGEWINDNSFEFVEKYQHRQEEILQHLTKESTSTQDSPNTVTSVNDNEIYLNVVGGLNYKGNVYVLGTLSKRFRCSKSAPSTSIAPVEDQIEEMRETINKLNVEFLAKTNKERTLKIMTTKVRRCDNRCKSKMSKFVNKMSKCSSIVSAPSPSTIIADGIEHHVDDAQVDRPHVMLKDH